MHSVCTTPRPLSMPPLYKKNNERRVDRPPTPLSYQDQPEEYPHPPPPPFAMKINTSQKSTPHFPPPPHLLHLRNPSERLRPTTRVASFAPRPHGENNSESKSELAIPAILAILLACRASTRNGGPRAKRKADHSRLSLAKRRAVPRA